MQTLDEVILPLVSVLGPTTALQLRGVKSDFQNSLNYDTLKHAAAAWGSETAQLSELIRSCEVVTDAVYVAVLVASRHGGVSLPNAFGQTPLMWAAGRGDEALCVLLLSCGASVGPVDSSGWTALFRAAWHGHHRIIRILLEADADVNSQTAKYTPLMASARFGYHLAVKELLQKGARTSLTTAFGETALSLARDQGHANVVSLLEGGALGVSCVSDCRRHSVRGSWQAYKEFEAAVSGRVS